jgi:AcrR family transcriptional regulator
MVRLWDTTIRIYELQFIFETLMPLQAHAKQKVRQARQDAYRDLILEAAQQVFAEKGYAEAKVADIAQAAGVATGTVYATFPGKQDLYRAVHRANLHELARRYDEIPGGRSVRETLLARSEISTRFLTSRPAYLRIYLREAERWGFDPGHLPGDAAAFVDLSLFERGVANGELIDEDPQLLQSLVLASGQVHLAHWLRGDMREDPGALALRIQAFTRRAIFRPESVPAA